MDIKHKLKQRTNSGSDDDEDDCSVNENMASDMGAFDLMSMV